MLVLFQLQNPCSVSFVEILLVARDSLRHKRAHLKIAKETFIIINLYYYYYCLIKFSTSVITADLNFFGPFYGQNFCFAKK